MKISHDPEVDWALVMFEERPSFEGFELFDNIIVHIDEDEHVIEIELDRASERLDLDALRARAARSRAAAPAA